eukprot:403351402
MESTQSFLDEKVNHISKSNPDLTLAVIITQADLKDQSIEFLKPHTQSEHFVKDLESQKLTYIYSGSQRFLLALYKPNEKDSQEKQRGAIRTLAGNVVAQLQAKEVTNAHVLFSHTIDKDLAALAVNALVLSNYHFAIKQNNKSGSTPDKSDYHYKIKSLTYSHSAYADFEQDEQVRFQLVLAEATQLSRTLGNTRASIANPTYMEEQVRKLVDSHANKEAIKSFTVITGKELEDQGMNLLYYVGKGASQERAPRCIVVEYRGLPESDEVHVALVGKGITFDTGGLNIKGTGNIEDMYTDKGGACVVMGALQGALDLKLKQNIIFAMAFAENSIGPECGIPNDIIVSLKGLTVEIGNTDAEGRLVLADTFTYVQNRFKPQHLIDFATLTGAIRIALGNQLTGIFSNDDEFAHDLRNHGLQVYEPSWVMPITDEARENMASSKSADLSNNGLTSFGGAIKAAAFLERFIEEGTKWCHLDIAGSSHHYSQVKAPICHSFNGCGVMTVLNYLSKKQ